METQKDKNNKILSLLVLAIFVSFCFGIIGGVFGVKFFAPKLTIESPKNNVSGGASQVTTSQEKAVIEAVKKVSPAVVSVILTKDVPVFEEYWSSPFQFFPEYRQKGTEEQKVGGGSGFIISSDGLILTNKHVVEEEDVEYTVVLSNGKKYSAKILARDPLNDIAILKINEKNLPTVTLGDSDKIQVGQSVIAIGYALGEFQNTVSVGVISGVGRNIVAGSSATGQTEELSELIQTDAAINEGNSGGPLLNLSGEVIGINTAMASGAENIGFAIPINTVKKAIEEVKSKGKITYPFLGINYVLINSNIKEKYNLSVDYGALIVRDENGISVVPGSAADKAGLKENDIILEVDGKKVNEKNPLNKIIASHKPGDQISLKVLRRGKEMIIKAVLGER
jgi:serine protease Do